MPSIYKSTVNKDSYKYTTDSLKVEEIVEEHANFEHFEDDRLLLEQRQRFIRYYGEFNFNINDIDNFKCKEESNTYINTETKDLLDFYCPSKYDNSMDKYNDRKLFKVNSFVDKLINLPTLLNRDIYNLFTSKKNNIQEDNCYALVDISNNLNIITIPKYFSKTLVYLQDKFNQMKSSVVISNFISSVNLELIQYLNDIEGFIIPMSKNLRMKTSKGFIFDLNDSKYNEKQFEFAFKNLIYNHLKLIKTYVLEFSENEDTFKHSADLIVINIDQVIINTLKIALINDKCGTLKTSKPSEEKETFNTYETNGDGIPNFTTIPTSSPPNTPNTNTIPSKSTDEVTNSRSIEPISLESDSPNISTISSETIDNLSTTEITTSSDKPTGTTLEEIGEEIFEDELPFFPTERHNEISTRHNQDHFTYDNTPLTTTVWESNQDFFNLTDLNQTGFSVVENNTNVYLITGLVCCSLIIIIGLIVGLIYKGVKFKRLRSNRLNLFPLA